MSNIDSGGVGVLENVSKILGRPVKALTPVASKTPEEKPVAEPKPTAKPASEPGSMHEEKLAKPKERPSIDEVLGRKVEPIPMEPIVKARFQMYAQARKNGFDPATATKTAMAEAAVMTPDPSNWKKLTSALYHAPTGTGKTFGQIGDEVGEFVHRGWENPLGISDEKWEKTQKQVGDYLEKIDKEHLGKGKIGQFATGLDVGGFKFAGEQLAPGQIALLVGTFGESALVRAGQKLGIESAPTVARTISKLMQIQFGAQMVEGTASGIEQTVSAVRNGNWQEAGEAAIGGLVSGLMARGLVTHEIATERVRGDLENTAREMYGEPEGGPIGSNLGSRFEKLNPYDQALVIDKTVKDSPEYNSFVAAAENDNDKERKKQEQRLTEYHDKAIGQAWEPDAVKRTFGWIDESRRLDHDVAQRSAIEATRQHYLRQIVSTLKTNVQEGQRQAEEQRQETEKANQEGREERPARKAEARQKKSVILTNAQQTREARVAAVDIRTQADKQRTTDEAVRKVDTQVDGDGHTSYQAQYYGETNKFGVAGDENHMGVYRETPRGVEYMTPWGTYSDKPEEAFIAPDEHTAQTLAQISSLRHSAESLAEQEGTNSAHHEESAFLTGLERDLASGEKTADEVRKEAKLPEQIELPTEVDALRSGNLKGPLNDKSEVDYLSELDQQATEAGFSPDETEALLGQAALTIRAETENNLHHITRSGDYVESKKGVRWTLDSRGMMHPSDGSAPVPLLKNGRYSSQVMDIARSGKTGWSSETREERSLQKAKERAVQAAITPDLSRAIDDAIIEARKQQQNEGLLTLPGEEPAPEEPDRKKAIARQSVKQHYKEQREKDKKSASHIADLIQQALEKSGAKELVQHIADGNGMTAEQVIRAQLANDTDSVEGKIASLEPGDKITDKFRPEHPWVVERRPDGEYQISSRGATLPLDHLNPSERIKGLVRDGGVDQVHPLTEGDFERAAFKAPYIVNRDQLVDQVEAIAAGERQVPEPSTLAQAQAQAAIAERRSEAAMSNAVDKQAEALSPLPGTTEREAEIAVAESEKAIHTAEAAVAQEAEAQSKTVPKDTFPARAPISIGRRGDSGVIKQNGIELPMHYEMVPVDALVSSHIWNGNVLDVNPDYTSELQPRTIDEDESKKNALRGAIRQPGGTEGYDFREYADKTINGSMGPAIIEPGGRIVGGNTRTAIMRKYLQNLSEITDPEDREVAKAMFRDQMNQLARAVGVTPPEDGLDYTVVRVLDKPIEDLREAANLGRLFNKSVSVQMTESAKGVSYARSLTPENLSTIGRLIEDHDGILPAIAANPEYFARLVTDRFGVTPEEYANWFEPVDEGKGFRLNDAGKSQFSKIMLGTVFKDTETLSVIQGEVPYRALERALANMVRLRAIGEKNITRKIVEAVAASAQTLHTDPALSHANDRWAATYRPDQVAFLGMDAPPPPEPDRMTEVLWRALHGSKAASPRVFSERLDNFIGADSASNESLFGTVQETPAETFNRVFQKEFAEVAHSRKDSPGAFRGISQAEYDASLQNVEFSDLTRQDAIRTEEGKPQSKQAPSNEVEKQEVKKKSNIFEPPPIESKPAADKLFADAKAEKGYVTSSELQTFLEGQDATKEHAPEIMRVAQMMSEYVFDADPPEGIDRKGALDWVLKERVAKLEAGAGKGRGSYSDPLIEKGLGTGILKLTKAADETTFIHEFAHVIFPLLSEEDHRNINTIHHEKHPQWDINTPLRGESYRGLTEKFASALEKFLRDQNPRGFSAEVKLLLAKVKEMVRKAYLRFIGDPLSEFRLTDEAKGIFADMFHIEDLDISDSWHEEVKKAKAEGKRLKGPLDSPHPVAKLASDMGAQGIRKNFAGKIMETSGDRVDPKKPTAVLYFPGIEHAAAAWTDVGNPSSKIQNAELIQGEDGSYGIRFNTEKQVPNDVLYQDVQRKHPGVELEEIKKRLASTPASAPMVRKLLQLKVQNLENEIRSKFGAEERKPVDTAEAATTAVQEKKNAITGKQAVSELRRLPERPAGDVQRRGDRQVLKPAVLGGPNDAAVRSTGGPLPGTRQLAGTKPVRLEPLPGRGQPVGILHGSKFDAKVWIDGLRKAGLPENLPPPTVTISHDTAQQLKYAGQKQMVQAALSALENGDGFIVASGTGTGKTYTSSGIIKEFQQANPAAKILYITKNTGLLERGEDSFKAVAKRHFGLDVSTKVPRGTFDKGVHGATYQRLLASDAYKNTDWDLVVADESGEMRNWFRENNQQGKAGIEVIDKSKKAVYVSATPFHSPSEYGYVKKLGLWPPNQFDQWIAENFNHEKVGDKVFARLDPGKQAILRNQMIERGQFASQMISYEGFTTNFGVVPVNEETRRSLNRIHEGVSRAKAQLEASGKKALAARLGAFEATYTKAFLERTRVPEAIELAKRAREAGWHVLVFSETTSADLFRRPLLDEKGEEIEEAGTYRKLDDEMGGELSRIIPEFGNVFDDLSAAFGEQIGDYSGGGGTDAQRQASKDDFNEGRKPIMYTTYAAGGIGVSLHDKVGTRPRLSVFLGPPYSGVLLDQALGRTWRFGVNSDARAVFLATDSQPDIHLMATKIGPRMRALRASVQGERDALGSVMGNYSEEQKVRDRQDLLAYDQGNEVKVDARAFQQRVSRKVDVDNWGQITFPKADTAHNKGMKVEMAGNKGDDWATLYQDTPRRRFNQAPPTMEEIAARRKLNQVAKSIAEGTGLPPADPRLQLEPATREAVAGGSAAVGADISENLPEGNKAAAGKMAAEAMYKPGWRLGNDGVWRNVDGWVERKPGALEPPPGAPEDIKTDFWFPGMWSSETMIKSIARQAGTPEVGRDLVTMNRKFTEIADRFYADYANEIGKIAADHKLDFGDDKTMREIFDVVEGRSVSKSADVNKAAEKIADLMEIVHGDLASGDVKLQRPDGTSMSYKEISTDRRHMPHRIDWDAKIEDPQTKEVATLKEIMGKTFSEAKRARMLDAMAQEMKHRDGTPYSVNEVADYLNRMKTTPPVFGNIHRARVANFPIYKQDLGTLMAYFNQAAGAIAREKTFGGDLGKLRAMIGRIPSENGRSTIDGLFGQHFRPQDWSTMYGRIYNFMAGYEALSKMNWSTIKVPFHLANVPLSLGGFKGLVPVSKAILKSLVFRKEFHENTAMAGTIVRQVNPMLLMDEGSRAGFAHWVLKKEGFNAAYRWGRAISGATAKIWMEQHALDDLVKFDNMHRKLGNEVTTQNFKGEDETRRILKERMLIPDEAIDRAIQRKEWSVEDLQTAQRAFANFTMFSDNPLQMPEWARLDSDKKTGIGKANLHRAIRLSYLLQSFAVKIHSLVRETVVDEIHNGNYKPLAYLAITTPILGQMLKGAAAAIPSGVHRAAEDVEDKKHTKDAWDRYIEQFQALYGNHPVVAAMKIYVDGIASQVALEQLRIFADPLMDMMGGQAKKARAEFEYQWPDLVENELGPGLSTMFYHTYQLISGEFKSQLAKDPATASERAFMHWLTDEFPSLKLIPGLETQAKKPASTGGSSAPIIKRF